MRITAGNRVVRLSITALAMVALVACSDGSTDDGEAVTEKAPAPVLDGSYEVTSLTYDGRPYPPDQATQRWNIRTTCNDDGHCVTGIATAGPEGAEMPQVLLDDVDGTWQGTFEFPPVECSSASTGEVVGNAPNFGAMTLLQRSDGTVELAQLSASPSPCNISHTVTSVLRRIGDVDPAVPLPDPNAPVTQANPVASSLHGTYYLLSSPPAGENAQVPVKRLWSLESMCARNTGNCVAVASILGNPNRRVLVFRDGQWFEDYKTVDECGRSTAEEPKTTNIDSHLELTRTDTGEGPAQKVAGLEIWNYGGDCPNVRQFTVEATRVGE